MGSHPGDPQSLVVMDNCSIHDKHAIEAAAAFFNAQAMFLPPYSPIYNPIEKIFGRIKQWLRTNNVHCSFIPAEEALSDAFASITPDVCEAFIRGVSCYDV